MRLLEEIDPSRLNAKIRRKTILQIVSIDQLNLQSLTFYIDKTVLLRL